MVQTSRETNSTEQVGVFVCADNVYGDSDVSLELLQIRNIRFISRLLAHDREITNDHLTISHPLSHSALSC